MRLIGYMAGIPLKEKIKIRQLIDRIESGEFDSNDVDAILIKIRPYAGSWNIVREIADFVAHADARNKGVACDSMTGFSDSMRFFVEYTGNKQALDISQPFPAYVYRLFLSQAKLSNEAELRQQFRMSHGSLIKKIEGNFKIDKTTRTCSIRPGKYGRDFVAALGYVIGFIHSKPAFDIAEFHTQLQAVFHERDIQFNAAALSAQADRMSLAILCLISGTEVLLPDGDKARCVLSTEHNFRILEGQRRLPIMTVTSEPSQFGTLQVSGEIQVVSKGKPLQVAYPLVTTQLSPHEHCESSVFEILAEENEFGIFCAEFINLEPDMALTANFKITTAAALQ